MIELKCHFDGTSIVLDEPAALPVNVPFVVKIDEPITPPSGTGEKKKRVWGQFKGQTWMSPDFDDPLPDSFWGFDK